LHYNETVIGAKAFFDLPFVQIALPIVITFVMATWYQGKRLDDLRSEMIGRFDGLRSEMIGRIDGLGTHLNGRIDGLGSHINGRIDETHRRLDEIIKRLDHIDAKLENHENRITRLEAPFVNR
jgi:hypothetical protein